jgi:5,10-methylenetetrahydromethanopterin reductase
MAPVDMAANTALLNATAPGGAYLGVVRGAWLDAHGVTEPAPPLTAIREAAEIIRLLLAGKSGGYAGEIYQIADHVRAPYPLPNSPIPLMIGTWGPKLCALAGEIADEVKVGGSANPDIVPIIQQRIAAGERKAERAIGTVGVVLGAVSVVDEDRQAARAQARREVALYLPVVAALDPTLSVEPELLARIETHVNRGEPESAAALISDDLLDRFALAGDPADLVAHCEAIFATGASRIEFGTPHGLPPETGIRLLGEKVLPVLQSYGEHWFNPRSSA